MKLTIWLGGCFIIGVAAQGFLDVTPFNCFISFCLGAGFTRALQYAGILTDKEYSVIFRRIK